MLTWYLLKAMIYLLPAIAEYPVLIACYLIFYYAYLLTGNILLLQVPAK
jgi:hypothetical protein